MKKLFILLALLIAGCGKRLPVLDGLDLNAWRNDKNGCGHVREQGEASLRTQLEKLKILDESQIVSLLGHPDRTELYKRNQKFYTYYLTPSPRCNPAQENPKKLIIRFNGMRVAKEVTVE